MARFERAPLGIKLETGTEFCDNSRQPDLRVLRHSLRRGGAMAKR